jgi:hypothetical protein
MNQNKTMEDDCNKIVHSLKKSKINFLAVDFDLTLICEHTGGRWVGGGQELAIKVRPLFKLLIPLALKQHPEQYKLLVSDTSVTNPEYFIIIL